MKHCICVIEESVIGIGLHNFYVYVKTPPRDNDLPTLPDIINQGMNIQLVDELLEKADYKKVEEEIPGVIVPTLAEFVLNEFWAVDFLFYDPQGKFIRRQLYEMQLGAILRPLDVTESGRDKKFHHETL